MASTNVSTSDKWSNINDHGNSSINIYSILLAITMGMIILSSVVGNVFTLIAVYRVRALHTITSVFVVNLAVADALAGLTCMPFTLVSSLADRWIFGDTFCRIQGFLNGTFCITSLMTLGAVAVERYHAIVHPFTYHEKMTKTIACVMIAITWIYSIFAAGLPLIGWSHYVYWDMEYLCTVAWNDNVVYTTFITVTCFDIPFAVLIYTYFNILKVAIKHQRAVAASTRSYPRSASANQLHDSSTINGVGNGRGNGNSGSSSSSSSSESKAAFVLFIVIGTFVLCWAPHGIGMLCLAFCNQQCPIPKWYFAVSTWLAMLNSGCNPIIYGIMNRQFREAYGSILRCSCWGMKNIRYSARRV